MTESDQPQFRIGDDGEIEDNLPLPEYKPKRKGRSRLIRGTRRLVRLIFWLIIIGLSGLGGVTAIHLLRINTTPPPNPNNVVVPISTNCTLPIYISGTSGKLLIRMVKYTGKEFYDDLYLTNFDGSERRVLKK